LKRKNTYEQSKVVLTVETALKEFSDVVYRVALNLAKHDADANDIFQDVFMRFMKYGVGKEFDSMDHAKHWFIRVTMNVYHTWVSKAKRRVEIEKDGTDINLKEKKRDLSTVTDCVQDLDEKYRIVVHLYYYESYKINEIALLLGENENTIKTRLSRAKKMLKTKLKDELGGG